VRIDVRSLTQAGIPTEHVWDVLTKDGKDVFSKPPGDDDRTSPVWAIGNPHVDADGRIHLNFYAMTSGQLNPAQRNGTLPVPSLGHQSASASLQLEQGAPTHLELLGMNVTVWARVLPAFTQNDDHARAAR